MDVERKCRFCEFSCKSVEDIFSHMVWCSSRPSKLNAGDRKEIEKLISLSKHIKSEDKMYQVCIQQLVVQNMERIVMHDSELLKSFHRAIRKTSLPMFPGVQALCSKHSKSGDGKETKSARRAGVEQDLKWLPKLSSFFALCRETNSKFTAIIARVQSQIKALEIPGCHSTLSHRRIRPEPQHFLCKADGKKTHCSLLSTICSVCGSQMEKDISLAPCKHNKRCTPMAVRKAGPLGNWRLLLPLREKAVIGALRHTEAIVAKLKPERFKFHAGDIIFLYRNAYTRTSGAIKEAAKKAITSWLRRW
eukprot:1374441-Amorphochlora_amoeboformis.AAC.1